MSDQDFDFDDNTSQQSPGKGLRVQLEAALAKLAELEAQNGKLSTQLRSRSVADTIAELGLNPKISRFIPADVAPEKDAIESWLSENGDVFGYQKPAPSGQDQEAENDASNSAEPRIPAQSAGLPPEVVAAMQRVQTPEAVGGTPSVDLGAGIVADLKSLMDKSNGSLTRFSELLTQAQRGQ